MQTCLEVLDKEKSYQKCLQIAIKQNPWPNSLEIREIFKSGPPINNSKNKCFPICRLSAIIYSTKSCSMHRLITIKVVDFS